MIFNKNSINAYNKWQRGFTNEGKINVEGKLKEGIRKSLNWLGSKRTRSWKFFNTRFAIEYAWPTNESLYAKDFRKGVYWSMESFTQPFGLQIIFPSIGRRHWWRVPQPACYYTRQRLLTWNVGTLRSSYMNVLRRIEVSLKCRYKFVYEDLFF